MTDQNHRWAAPTVDEVEPGWTPATLNDRWRWSLTAEQIDEVLRVAQRIDPDDCEALSALSPGDLPLPSLAERLAELRRDLLGGRGFAVIGGLPVDDIGERRATAAALAVSIQLGCLRWQNRSGDLVGHVRNVGARSSNPDVRLYQTSERQTFHTDSTDVVGLLMLQPAAEGGDSLVVSAAAVFHHLARHHPNLVAALFQPVATDRRGETPPGADPWFTIPVFTWWHGRLTVMYQRQYIDSAARFDEAPPLTDRHIEALDAFDAACNDPALHVSMTLQPGDLQFVHNHSTLHDRTAFTDEPGRPRHLIRTWISVPEDRPLHPVFAQRFGSVTPGRRGGITT